MKVFLVMIAVLVDMLYANVKSDKLNLYINSSPKTIELKWLVDDYSSKNSYKIYRSVNGSKFQYLTTIKPRSYKNLKSRGYSDDYIFLIYPDKDVKNVEDRVKLLKIQESVQGFRNLKVMQEKIFAKNIGQYFIDKDLTKDKIYIYLVQMYKGKKFIYQKIIQARAGKVLPKSDFMWVRANNMQDGIILTWDMQNEFSFFNVYRKKKNEKKFTKLNKDPIYLSRNFTKKTKVFFIDKDLKIAEEATYYIRKIDQFSNEGKPSKKVTITRSIVIKKPPLVKNLFVKSGKNKIVLRWQKNYNILGYNVYRSDIYQDGYTKINKNIIKKELYIDKTIQAGKNYYYYVTSENMHGESKPSMKLLAYTRDVTPPKRPKNLRFKVKDGEVDLKWNSPKDKDIIGYRIYISMDEDATQWSLINEKLIKNSFFKHKRSKTLSRFYYYYRVKAVDKNYNESFPSNIVKVKLPDVAAPKQPHITQFNAYSDKIRIQWNKIIVYDLSHYNVYRKVGKKFEKLNKIPLKKVIFTDKNPKDGINEYIVTSVDKSGNESYRKISKKIKLIDNKPVKIENFKLTKTKKGVKASFSCKDKDYAGFKLFKSSGKVLKYHNVSNFVKAKSFIDKQVSSNGTYFYMIKAYDKSGNISKSNILKIVLKDK